MDRHAVVTRLAGGIAATLRSILSPIGRDLSELRAPPPRRSSPDLESAARSEIDEKLDAMRKPVQQLEALLVEARDRAGTVQPSPGIPLSNLSGTPANTSYAQIRRDSQTHQPELPAENSAFLGRALFTDFLLPVELGGTLLLVAAIGAIAIGQRKSVYGDPRA